MLYFLYVVFVIFATVNCQNSCSSYDEISVPCKNPCQPTCENPTPQLSTPACQVKICNPGCICQENLLRDTESGACVPPSECPISTHCEGENEEFNWCASFCPTTCQSPCRNATGCILMCDQRCDCKPGFVRDEISWKCVAPSRCTRCKCRQNEKWTHCSDGCEATCSSLENPQKCVGTDPCTVGCVCAQGFIRNDHTGSCVPRSGCPPKL